MAFASVVALLPLPLPAQTPPPGAGPDWIKPPSPSAPLTREQIDATVAGYWAAADDPTVKKQAIDYLAPLIHSGEITADSPGAVALLVNLATEGTDRQLRSGSGTLANDYPVIRIRAVQLLGSIGGSTAREAVFRVCASDPSPDVRTAAVSALPALVESPTANVMTLLRGVLQSNNTLWLSDRLALSTLDVVAMLYRAARQPESPGIRDPMYVAPILQDPALAQAIADVAMGSYNSAVRRRAVEVLDMIRDSRNR
ncbi:MAG TPA: HEAT repeat domain-containing protein [Spirochaetia bacterium]|nr:HEAT repeat domain-containing protein [Spirochaetia bacterium]